MEITEKYIHLRCKTCDHGLCGDTPPPRPLTGTVFTRKTLNTTENVKRKCPGCLEASWKRPNQGLFDTVMRVTLSCPNCGTLIYGVDQEG
jgi:Zn finger protein HypA/HybF involved in hydrogenase expression